MTGLISWLRETPLMWWPIATAILSLVYNALDGIPRVHAVLSVLVKAGFDLPGILDALKRLVLGTPTPNAMAKRAARASAAARIGGSLLMLITVSVLACQGACTRSQVQQVATTTVDTLVCVLNHETEPPAQIAIECGVAEVSDIVKVLDAHRAAEVREQADAGPHAYQGGSRLPGNDETTVIVTRDAQRSVY